MSKSTKYGIVLVTVSSPEQGEIIAKTLLNEKLAACVTLNPVNSWYWWQGEINSDREYQLIIKTNLDLFARLASTIKTLHNYEVPEIVAIPIIDGSESYLNWLGENLQKPEIS